MHEMEGPSPGLVVKAARFLRPLSHLSAFTELLTSEAPVTRLSSRGITSPEVSLAVPISPRVAFRLGDVSFLLPPSVSRKGFDQRFQDFRSLHSSIHRIRMVIPRADKFLHRLSTPRDEVRPRGGARCRCSPPSMMLTSPEAQTGRNWLFAFERGLAG